MEKRVNISCTFPEDVLSDVQQKITPSPEEFSQGVEGPAEFEQDFRAQGVQGEFLDLVAHSYGNDFLLYLGNAEPDDIESFVIEGIAANEWMKALLARKTEIAARGIKKLRLLGCLTAWEKAGRETMQKLRTDLGLVDVFGSINWLSADDFEHGGFKAASENKLVAISTIDDTYRPPGYPDLPAPPGKMGALLHDALNLPGIPVEVLLGLRSPVWHRWRIRGDFDKDRFMTLVAPREVPPSSVTGMTLRGLLTVPTVEFWLPVQGEPTLQRVIHIVGDYRMLCVYSPRLGHDNSFATAVMYRVARPRELKVMMAGLHQEEIPWRNPAHP